MRVLVTRPSEDAEPLASELQARGHIPVLCPMLRVRLLSSTPPDLTDVQAVLFTSANGVRAFAETCDRRDLPVLAVGEATAETARGFGFRGVEAAGGDVVALARLVRTRLAPYDGALFHAAGSVTAGDLKGMLEADGFTVRRVAMYEAAAVTALPADAKSAIEKGRIDTVLFFSPRTAKTFVTLVAGTNLATACKDMTAVCLSQAVANAVTRLPWHSVRVAERPERAALLRSLEALPADTTKDTMSDETPKGQTPKDRDDDRAAETPAQKVVTAFGGIRPMAHKLGIAVSTVQGWKNRGMIPESRHNEIEQAAKKHGVALDPDLLRAAGEEPPGEAGADAASRGEAEREHAAAAEAVAATTADTAQDETGAASSEPAAGGETPERQPPPPPPPPRDSERSGSGGWMPGMLLGAAIVLIAVGGTVVTRDAWLPVITGVEPERPAEMEEEIARIDALERQLRRVEEQQTEPAEVAEVMEAMAAMRERLETATQRLDSGSERIDQLAERVDAAGERADSLADQMDTLTETQRDLAEAQRDVVDPEDLRRAAREVAGRQVAQTLAVSELREALRSATPFETELEMAQRVVEPDSELADLLDELAPYAETGIPTEEQLVARFDPAANDAMARAAEDAGHGWVGGVLRRLTDAVSVRPVGEQPGEATGAVLARAESRLEAGNLQGAIATLEELDGGAREAMEPWLEQARGRLMAEDTLSAVSAQMIDMLTQADRDGA